MEMVCAYCGGQLERGHLRSRGLEYFLPDGQRPTRTYTKKSLDKRNAVMIPVGDESFGAWPVAYICRCCRKIVIPY